MKDPPAKQSARKRLLLDVVATLLIVGAVFFLFRGHLEHRSLGTSDNAVWRDEAQDRQTLWDVFDVGYHTERHILRAYYNPLQILVWQFLTRHFDYDTEVFPYYLFGLLIHLSNTVLLFFIARRLASSRAAALLAALGFGVFYPNYHTTGWVSGIVTTGLSTFFIFASFLAFVLSFELERRRARTIALVCSSLLFVLGMLTKEYVVITAVVCALYYALLERRRTLRPTRDDLRLLPHALIAIPFALIVVWRVDDSAIVTDWGGFNFGLHVLFRAFEYVVFLVTVRPAGTAAQLVVLSLVLALLPLLALASRRRPVVAFLLLWLFSLVLMFSVSNFRDVHTLERYLYLPSAPFFLLLFVLPELVVLEGRERAQKVARAGLTVVAAALTIGYNASLILGVLS